MCGIGVAIRWLLNCIDTNGDGHVDRDEFRQFIREKADSIHERKRRFQARILTQDDDGKVSYQRIRQIRASTRGMMVQNYLF